MKGKTNDIIEKAAVLFMQHGLHSVSMDDVASSSGISKKTLYWNFKSKQIIVNTIVQKLIAKTGKYIRLCPDISPNAVKEMENFSDHILSVLEIVTPKFIRDLKKYYPETYTRLIVFRDSSIIPYLESCLKRGITEGIFRPEIDKTNTAWLYCWQLQNVLEGNIDHADVTSVIENANGLFLRGILHQKGLKLLSMTNQIENMGQKEKQVTG